MDPKIPFSKQYEDPKNLILLLQSRGLAIENAAKAETYIRNIGYYRLSAYMYPFLKIPKKDHLYKEGTNFNNVLRLYGFDKHLRILIFNEIEKIEIAVRSTIVNVGCKLFLNPFWMTDAKNFTDQIKYAHTLKLIDDALKKSKEEFILHFRSSYTDPYPPAWILAEILPFGILTRLFSNLKDKKVKKHIAQYFGLQTGPFESWLTIVTLTRNSCCHHSRVWNSQNTIRPMIPKKVGFPWIFEEANTLRIYFNICIIKHFLNIISPENDFSNKLIDLLERYPEVDIHAMGFSNNWRQEPVWK